MHRCISDAITHVVTCKGGQTDDLTARTERAGQMIDAEPSHSEIL